MSLLITHRHTGIKYLLEITSNGDVRGSRDLSEITDMAIFTAISMHQSIVGHGMASLAQAGDYGCCRRWSNRSPILRADDDVSLRAILKTGCPPSRSGAPKNITEQAQISSSPRMMSLLVSFEGRIFATERLSTREQFWKSVPLTIFI